MPPPPPTSPLFPYTTLFRSNPQGLTWTYEYNAAGDIVSETDFDDRVLTYRVDAAGRLAARTDALGGTISFERDQLGDRKSTRLNSSHVKISYAVFCLKKKNT